MAEFRYVYYASAYDESVAFYRDVLGAEQVDGWDGGRDNRGAILAVGGGFIEVIAVPPPDWLGELGKPRDSLRGPASSGWLLIEATMSMSSTHSCESVARTSSRRLATSRGATATLASASPAA